MVAGHQGIDGLFQVQLMSMINSLKTGDPTTDMVLAMVLPYLIGQFANDLIKTLKKLLVGWFKKEAPKPQKMYERSIVHRTQLPVSNTAAGSTLLSLDKDRHNLVLIKAMEMYVDKHCKFDLEKAEIDLTSMDVDPSGFVQNNFIRRNHGLKPQSRAMTLKSYHLTERPPQCQYHNIGVFSGFAVKVRFDDSIARNKGKSQNDAHSDENKDCRRIEARLKSTSKEAISTFVRTAYSWYLEQLEGLENNDRYYFDLNSFDCRNNTPSFTRYLLADGKTFDTLFSQKCLAIKKVVDQFEAKSGKYAIEGYPHKLGLLLSGPPGTGKTSLIKALAHYTNRHVINVPLSMVNSNTQLMSLMFHRKYPVDDGLIELDFKRLIFVFEDIDAESPVVKCRKLRALEQQEEAEKLEKGARHAEREALRATRATRSTPTRRSSRHAIVAPSTSQSMISKSALNLTGILNALDGVVECPGRMIIMTSNHPEVLDSALTRPGRIDKHVVMGYMEATDMQAMIEHYFGQKLTNEQVSSMFSLIDDKGLKMTPAKLECMTIEMETIDELLELLEKNVHDNTETEGLFVSMNNAMEGSTTSTVGLISDEEDESD